MRLNPQTSLYYKRKDVVNTGVRRSPDVSGLILLAGREARALGHRVVTTGHLLLALYVRDGGVASSVLRQSGVKSSAQVRKLLAGMTYRVVQVDSSPCVQGETLPRSFVVTEVMSRAELAVGKNGKVTTREILTEILDRCRQPDDSADTDVAHDTNVVDDLASVILSRLGIETSDIRDRLNRIPKF